MIPGITSKGDARMGVEPNQVGCKVDREGRLLMLEPDGQQANLWCPYRGDQRMLSWMSGEAGCLTGRMNGGGHQ